ncbi:Protein of unknown function [Pyronema omphalodes CBS 100304]|uniref:Uncharacterized protein n=1 Tax=Pyronema omphalodes (strain CBS 100304) TaxID=1076935 RepID=U4LHG7_PYROM|nr:Protein of unknown function [Pyronema omphalodes CBS 100304]
MTSDIIPREPGENTSPAMEKTDTRRQSFLPFLAVDYLIDASDSPFVSEVFRNRQWGENTEPKPTMREVSSNASNRVIRFEFRKSRQT